MILKIEKMAYKLQSLLLLTILANRMWALDPTQSADGYIRTNFTLEDGLPSGYVNAIVQSKNGFLWIGTNTGLAVQRQTVYADLFPRP